MLDIEWMQSINGGVGLIVCGFKYKDGIEMKSNYGVIKIIAATVFCMSVGLINSAKAAVTNVGTNFDVSYGINLTGTSNGNNINGVFIFEWNNSNFNIDSNFTIAGQGNTFISHTINFDPTSALLIGYGKGIAGIGDEKDHLFTLTSSDFADTVLGIKWSEAFPGVTPESRVGHNTMISYLINATAGDLSSIEALTRFVKTEGLNAAFDPAGKFEVLEWSVAGPVGSSIPEPATLVLFGLGLAGLCISRRKKL